MIYLASPYTDSSAITMQMRYSDALYATAKFLAEGHHIYSPIVHFHAIACLHNLPRDADFWWDINSTMIRKADALWVLKLTGWQNSIGVMKEIVFATDLGLPIRYVELPGA